MKYRVALVGCGPRGVFHGNAFRTNSDRFELAGICDIVEEKLCEMARSHPGAATFTDAEKMLSELKPDVLCFATLPAVRLKMIELGVKYNVRAIAYEKPMATSLAEAHAIDTMCREAGVRTLVSHQQKYGAHWQTARAMVEAGEIGEVHTLHAAAQGWLLQYGTHLMDYMMFLNTGARVKRVVGHVHGREKLTDSHPSPDYAMAQMEFDNGVRGIMECGTLAPRLPGNNEFWLNAGITVYGSEGYVQVVAGGGSRAVTRASGGKIEIEGNFNEAADEIPYIRDLGDWLDDPEKVHPCNGDVSYHGFQAVIAACISSIERRPVILPLEEIPGVPVIDRLREIL